MIKLTIIVSYYKALDNLKVIFKALNQQSCMEFEVIISEDDNNIETIEYIDNEINKLKFPIIHLCQDEDNGFQKNMMLNKSIMKAKSEKLAFLDGDCIPHKHFAKNYIKYIKKNNVCIGRAVMLDDRNTTLIKETQSLHYLNFFKLLFSKSENLKDGIYSPFLSLTLKPKGIIGRNWGCGKQTLIDVNGFDEDYKYAGVGEDCDIEWRLLANGVKKQSVKNRAIAYHLFHKRWYSKEGTDINYALMDKKIEANNIQCSNGIKKL